jgi:hypothetical protein
MTISGPRGGRLPRFRRKPLRAQLTIVRIPPRLGIRTSNRPEREAIGFAGARLTSRRFISSASGGL